ncbi:hypothetical protein GRI94_12015 [Erythrobacter jejuensis]|uniref:Uncharacterized protein n=2 Tax=Parerythrobacter jejuensis TaxID=795812 RepID=A0A845AVM6_9SPHN|nr:hypothetical protein [Parerythrobacter jejuensis]
MMIMAASVPLAAQDEPERVDKGPDVEDVAMTPIQDLNLAKDEIPAVLATAAADPYATGDLGNCRAIGNEIGDLTAVLGPDLDVEDGEDGLSVGKAAQSAVGSLIPFRGILREVTGAADNQRKFEAAILAGAVRRGFLKGLGQQRGCAYPARPAFTGEITVKDGDE